MKWITFARQNCPRRLGKATSYGSVKGRSVVNAAALLGKRALGTPRGLPITFNLQFRRVDDALRDIGSNYHYVIGLWPSTAIILELSASPAWRRERGRHKSEGTKKT